MQLLNSFNGVQLVAIVALLVVSFIAHKKGWTL